MMRSCARMGILELRSHKRAQTVTTPLGKTSKLACWVSESPWPRARRLLVVDLHALQRGEEPSFLAVEASITTEHPRGDFLFSNHVTRSSIAPRT